MKINPDIYVDNCDGTGHIHFKTRAKESTIFNFFEKADSRYLWTSGFNGWDKTEKGFVVYIDISEQPNAEKQLMSTMEVWAKDLETVE